MIRTYQAQQGGLAFERASMRRQKAGRNRMAALAVIAAVAASAGVLQHFKDNLTPGAPASFGAVTYSAAR